MLPLIPAPSRGPWPRVARMLLAVAATVAFWGGGAHAAIRVDLDQGWSFKADRQGVALTADWVGHPPADARPVDIPHTWNIEPGHPTSDATGGDATGGAAIGTEAGVDDTFDGLGWYFRTLSLPTLTPGSHVELHFGATFYKSRVWVNGVEAGGHEGGFTEYWLDVSHLIHPGANSVVVSVDNRPGFATIPGYAMRLRASGSVWYDWWRFGGMVRDVWLTIGDEGLIRRQRVTSHLTAAPGDPTRFDAATVEDRVFIENTGAAADFRLTTTLRDPEGAIVAREEGRAHLAAGGAVAVPLTFTVTAPQLWNVAAARLYQVESRLWDQAGRLLDSHSDTIGLRRVEIRDRHLYVNGRRVRLSGVSRHADSPWEGLAETRGTIREDWDDLAALHTTLTRPVHYPQSAAVLAAADRAGILLVPEIPVWQFTQAQLRDPRVLALAQAMMGEVIDQDANHPSIFAWSVCNESDASTPGGEAYVKAMKAYINAHDPGRFVTFADADIAIRPWKKAKVMDDVDFIMANAYFGTWSGDGAQVDAWLDQVDRNYPDKMVVISEFGWPGPFSHDAATADRDRVANMRQQMAAFAKRDFIAGVIYWTYQDYKSPRNLWNGEVEGYVDHGLVDPWRQRKPSYRAWQTLNEPLSVRTRWISQAAGLTGFSAAIEANAAGSLPSYPLVGYRVRWRLTDPDGTVRAQGGQALPADGTPAAPPVVGGWPAITAPARLTIDVLTPAGVRAGGAVMEYAPLRLGSAPFPPDPAQSPPPKLPAPPTEMENK